MDKKVLKVYGIYTKYHNIQPTLPISSSWEGVRRLNKAILTLFKGSKKALFENQGEGSGVEIEITYVSAWNRRSDGEFPEVQFGEKSAFRFVLHQEMSRGEIEKYIA